MGISGAFGDHSRDRPSGDAPGGLDEHLEVESVGEAPQDLADVVAREGSE
jgi:hypothetical protein